MRESQEKLPDLPRGWAYAKIGEICNLVNGRAFKAEDWSSCGLPIIRIQNLNNHYAEFNYCSFDVEDKYYVDDGQLLFAWSGTPGTSFGAHIWNRGKGILNQHIFKVNINEKYLNKKFFMNVINYNVDLYIKRAHGTAGLAHITKGKFEDSFIPLPPLNEQHRIVARIEELFSRLDAGVEALRRAKAQLQRYRQSVLQAAVTGRLTAEWRAAHPEVEPAEELLRKIEMIRRDEKKRSNRIQDFDLLNLPKLPGTWQWVSIDQVSDLITDGDHNPPKRTSDGIPHLTAKNIKNWAILQEGCTYISEHDFESVRKRYYPLENDVIITCVGTVGRTALVPEDSIFSADRNLAAIRLTPNGMNPRFLQYNLNTPASQIAILNASGSTAQPHFYLGDIRTFPVALAPAEEQQEIINELERLFLVINELEFQLEINMKHSDRLRQSILKRAFQGQLVSQDPNDEPASLLLERIRAERKTESPRRGRKSNIHQARLSQ